MFPIEQLPRFIYPVGGDVMFIFLSVWDDDDRILGYGRNNHKDGITLQGDDIKKLCTQMLRKLKKMNLYKTRYSLPDKII